MKSYLKHQGASSLSLQMLDQMDPDHPGFGRFSAFDGFFHYPDAYGLIASSAIKLGKPEIAKRCIDWLVANSRLEGSRTGWGLPVEYLTFGEQPNPAHTIYGITNAIVTQSLLDYWELTREEYALDCAVRALSEYAEFFDKAHFFYSQNSSDNLMVPNVDAMLAGQYARISKYACDEDARRFHNMALATYDNIMAHMLPEGSWFYVYGRPKKNDILHHAYIVHGLSTVEHELGLKAKTGRSFKYMANFIHAKRVHELPVVKFRRRIAIALGIRHVPYARLWGIGAWLAASGGQQLRNSEHLTKILRKYRGGEGQFLHQPERGVNSIRHDAHLLWGLSIVANLGGKS